MQGVIVRLGVKHCEVVGNLKFDVVLDPILVEHGLAWHAHLEKNNRLMVCAASTREGEEAIILEAWQAVLKCMLINQSTSTAQPLLCIVPRHPERFAEVAELIRASGLTVLQRSEMNLDAAVCKSWLILQRQWYWAIRWARCLCITAPLISW
jgi:3-deoxy-D-manno-octulosonic-acid transferase